MCLAQVATQGSYLCGQGLPQSPPSPLPITTQDAIPVPYKGRVPPAALLQHNAIPKPPRAATPELHEQRKKQTLCVLRTEPTLQSFHAVSAHMESTRTNGILNSATPRHPQRAPSIQPVSEQPLFAPHSYKAFWKQPCGLHPCSHLATLKLSGNSRPGAHAHNGRVLHKQRHIEQPSQSAHRGEQVPAPCMVGSNMLEVKA